MMKLSIKYSGLLLASFTVSACSSFGYYLDLMAGHSELLEQRKPVAEIIEDKKTNLKLRKLLQKSQKIRNFASKELHLPENDSYRQYADLKRRYAVWNVVAAKEFSVKAKEWCFIFVGCLSYKGYFSKLEATNQANKLKAQGSDTYVAGANAYSTLGWFDDPLLNTMMYKSEARRAGIIFHELAHQVVYIDNDTAFNEAFATTVEQEGIKRWMVENGQPEQYKDYLVDKKRDSELNQLLKETRNSLKKLYKKDLSDIVKRERKAQIFVDLTKNYTVLKKLWGGYREYDHWMRQKLNNAHLLLISTYHELVPTFQAILKKQKFDLRRLYVEVERLGQLNKLQRQIELEKLHQ